MSYLQLARRKGSPLHRRLGKAYMILMLATAVITLFMPGQVGPQVLGHFGFIHMFSLLVLYTVPAAYVAAKAGRIQAHKGNMLGLYIGGLLVAGAFALSPGRLLHQWIFT